MNEQKRYTAQEMRNCADNCDWRINPCVAAMLRQAADAEARLEAVVKMLEEEASRTSCDDCNTIFGDSETEKCECRFSEQHSIYVAILRAARGEGGAE